MMVKTHLLIDMTHLNGDIYAPQQGEIKLGLERGTREGAVS